MRSLATFVTLAALLPSILAVPSPVSHEETHSKRALDYSVPSSWRKTTTTRSISDITNIARSAMQTMLNYKNGHANDDIGGMNYWPSANAWSSIVLTDFASNSQNFIGVTLDGVGDTFGRHPNFRANQWNDDTAWWALAAVYQYRAYGNTVALGWAKSSWEDLVKQQITGTSGNGKNFSWGANCNGKTTVGGVFWVTDPNNNYVNSITTDLFFALSAYLYEITKEDKYFQAAEKARVFAKNHFFDSSDSLLWDGVNIQNCGLTDWKFTYNVGKYIEGLAVLYTARGQTSYRDEALATAVAAMKGTRFQGSDGIITEGQGTPYDKNDDGRNFKGIYLRALTELYRRFDHADYRKLAKAYINNQANALIDLASRGSQYGVNWHGPMDAGYAWGQLAALDALAGFIAVNK